MRSQLLLCLLIAAQSGTATAAAGDEPRATVVLIHTANEPAHEPLWQLQLAVEAHLSSLPVAVTTALHDDGEINFVTAREILERQGALSVAWLAADRGSFYTFTPSLGDRAHPHELPAAGEAWATRCEVIASAWLPELEPLFGEAVEEVPPAETPASIPEPAETPQRKLPPFLASVAYLPMPVAGPTIYRSGVGVTAGLRIGTRLELTGEFNLMLPIPLGVPGSDARLARWPLRVNAALLWPVGRFELGGVAAVVLDLWQVRELGYTTGDPAATRLHADAGLSLAGRFRIRALPWLAPYADVGADLFFGADPFTLGEEVLFERGALQLRLVVGVVVVLGASSP